MPHRKSSGTASVIAKISGNLDSRVRSSSSFTYSSYNDSNIDTKWLRKPVYLCLTTHGRRPNTIFPVIYVISIFYDPEIRRLGSAAVLTEGRRCLTSETK